MLPQFPYGRKWLPHSLASGTFTMILQVGRVAAVESAKGARNRIGWLSHQPSLRRMGGSASRSKQGARANTVHFSTLIAFLMSIGGSGLSVRRRNGKLLILRLTPRGLRRLRLEEILCRRDGVPFRW